jgi:hypothetical protein
MITGFWLELFLVVVCVALLPFYAIGPSGSRCHIA